MKVVPAVPFFVVTAPNVAVTGLSLADFCSVTPRPVANRFILTRRLPLGTVVYEKLYSATGQRAHLNSRIAANYGVQPVGGLLGK